MGSLTKSQKLNRTRDMAESELRPEYHSISCELRALAKMVQDELGNGETQKAGFATSPSAVYSSSLFERGRFYEEYSARRNERLRRKKGQTGDQGKTTYNLGVTVESGKRSSCRKLESFRKSISAAYSVETTSETPRYMLRSMSKENKKPPLAAAVYSDKSKVGAGERKLGARRVRRN
ncbi:uncharacterized protein LOC107419801 isoform X2 [Ziziphus jujuba]|uniref:Uncharacterized protein LOC107419801 isoform X2 n=1 Tax=Ziziphus jujuba TaxID=326968 RepID=A0A6P6GA59_ZIZJJ|nr:uncharacterized protein LOC107419801 isoform X2 [Ziziphus jujuba]